MSSGPGEFIDYSEMETLHPAQTNMPGHKTPDYLLGFSGALEPSPSKSGLTEDQVTMPWRKPIAALWVLEPRSPFHFPDGGKASKKL